MKFYFPDSQDLVSPTYDFARDEYSPLRVRQRDDRYAHEVLSSSPTKAFWSASPSSTDPLREPGSTPAHNVPASPDGGPCLLSTAFGSRALGDNGAFNYVDEPSPPVTVAETLDFYEECGFDAGVSTDHVIFGYEPGATAKTVDSTVGKPPNINTPSRRGLHRVGSTDATRSTSR